MGSFDRGMAAALPVGSVIQSPLNLESMTNGQWIALDGRDCNRSDYPLIQSQFPAGVFTSTARTLAAAPTSAVIATDGTNFYACGGGTAATGLQASSDGVSWSVKSVGSAPNVPTSMIVAGSRLVVASGATTPYVATTGQTVANILLDANWTATTGGTTTTLTQGLAYSSTANGGSGRTVLVVNGSLATASGIFYLNDGATAWSAASGGSTATRTGVCWTGQKFICITSGTSSQDFALQTSSDGATWADAVINGGVYTAVTLQSIASDGMGTVVIAGSIVHGENGSQTYFGFLVSKDHGASWRFVPYDKVGASPTTGNTVHFVNGKFFNQRASASDGTRTAVTLISSDGFSWVKSQFTSGKRNPRNAEGFAAIAYKNGTYCAVRQASTAAVTVTENLAQFQLPQAGKDTTTISGIEPSAFMKVRN